MEKFMDTDNQLEIGEPKRCRAGSGAGWISQAWQLFKSSWLEFLIALVLIVAIHLVLELIPFLGPLLSTLLTVALAAGYLEMAHQAQQEEDPAIGTLFAAFQADKRDRLLQLLLLGGLSLVLTLVMGGIMAVAVALQLSGEAAFTQGQPITPEQLQQLLQSSTGLLIWGLGLLVLAVLYSCAVYFAVPLLWFADKRLLEALKLSFTACMRNIPPLLVFSLLAFVLMLLGAIPFGLGLLLVLPVLLIATYTSFRQIFVLEFTPKPPPVPSDEFA